MQQGAGGLSVGLSPVIVTQQDMTSRRRSLRRGSLQTGGMDEAESKNIYENNLNTFDLADEAAIFKNKMASSGGYYSSVGNILNSVTTSILSRFSDMDTDIKRVMYVKELDSVKREFQGKLVTINEKSEPESRKLREQGNKSYVAGEYKRALDFYTRSTFTAPASSGEHVVDQELALALANRSATLFQLEKHKASVQDMLLSLQHGYPEELRYKLYDRMGKCFFIMNRRDDAKYAFKKALKYLPMSTLADSKQIAWRENIQESQHSCSKSSTSTENLHGDWGEHKEPPPALTPRSDCFPSASDAFDIHHEEYRGRFAVAKHPLKAGDVVLTESPITAVPEREYIQSHCFFCFNPIDVPIPCFKCTLVRYCSGVCRDNAWSSWHELECPYLGHILESRVGKLGHMGLRVILAAGLDTILNKREGERSHHSKVLVDTSGEYIGGYEALLDLVGHSSGRNENEMFQYTLMAVYMSNILRHCGFYRTDVMKDRKLSVVENYVSGMLLRFLQIISCNGIDFMETHCTGNVQKTTQRNIGMGLYPVTALVNHSCNPNMESVFYGKDLCLRAIRNVSTGQELTIDYGYLYYSMEQSERMSDLKSQYHFDCTCEACYHRWPVTKKLPAGIPTLKCLKCSCPLSMTAQGHAGGGDNMVAQCRKCGHKLEPLVYLEEIYESTKMFEKAIDEVRHGNVDSAYPVLETHLSVMEKYLVLPVKDYVTCLSALKQCYRMMGSSVWKIAR